jgi:Heterokaryon incompatibility protein (HET)
MKGMAMAYLPMAVQDAIILCRRLRIPALWVESLCTVADHEDDLSKDLELKNEIYGNSHVTIFANSAFEGFLGPQSWEDPDWQRHVDVSIPPIFGAAKDSVILRTKNCCLGESGDFDGGSFLNFEARLLSKRRLVFTGREMIWSCNGRLLCECGHKEGRPVENLRAEVQQGLRLHQSAESPLQCWRQLVEQYSETMSENGSALADISGIAKLIVQAGLDARTVPVSELEKILQKAVRTGNGVQISALMNLLLDADNRGVGHYVAGLWTETFISDLAWSFDGSVKRKAQGFAPTWSWASAGGPVKYKYKDEVADWKTYDLHMAVRTKVEDITCVPASRFFPTGPLSSASAVLTGPLAEVELFVLTQDSALGCRAATKCATDSSMLPTGREVSSVILVRDRQGNTCPVAVDFESDLKLIPQTRQAKDSPAGDERKPLGFRLGVSPEPFYCLHLFTWENRNAIVRNGGLWSSQSQPWFLLLRKSRSDPNYFERAGLGFWERGVRLEYPYWARAWLSDGEECNLLDEAVESTVTVI